MQEKKKFLAYIRRRCLTGTITLLEWLFCAMARVLPGARRYRRLEDRYLQLLGRYRLLKERFADFQYRTETALLVGLLDSHQAQARFVGQAEAILRVKKVSMPVIMAHIEIDFFGQIADATTDIDQLVRRVALEIRDSLRRSDIVWSDGGDGKFSVILTDVDQDATAVILRNLQNNIKKNANIADAGVTLSIGATLQFVGPNDDLEEIFRALSIGAIGAMCLIQKEKGNALVFTAPGSS